MGGKNNAVCCLSRDDFYSSLWFSLFYVDLTLKVNRIDKYSYFVDKFSCDFLQSQIDWTPRAGFELKFSIGFFSNVFAILINVTVTRSKYILDNIVNRHMKSDMIIQFKNSSFVGCSWNKILKLFCTKMKKINTISKVRIWIRFFHLNETRLFH